MSLKSTVNLNVSSTHNNPVVYRGQKTGTTVSSRNVAARSSALPITTGAQLNTACADQYRAGGGGAYSYCSLAGSAAGGAQTSPNSTLLSGSVLNMPPATRATAITIGAAGTANAFTNNSALNNISSLVANNPGSDTQGVVAGVYQVQSVSTSASNVPAAQGNTMVLNSSDSVAPLGGSGPFQSITLDLCGPDGDAVEGSGEDRQVIILHPRDVTASTATTVTDAGPNNTLNRALHYLRVIDLPSPATLTQPVTQEGGEQVFMTAGERNQYPTMATILQPLTPGTATPTQPARIVLEKTVVNTSEQIPYSRHIIQVVQKPPLYTGMGGAVQVPMP